MTRKIAALYVLVLVVLALCTARYGAGVAHNYDGTTYRYAFIAWDLGGYEFDQPSPKDTGTGVFVCNGTQLAPLFPALVTDC